MSFTKAWNSIIHQILLYLPICLSKTLFHSISWLISICLCFLGNLIKSTNGIMTMSKEFRCAWRSTGGHRSLNPLFRKSLERWVASKALSSTKHSIWDARRVCVRICTFQSLTFICLRGIKCAYFWWRIVGFHSSWGHTFFIIWCIDKMWSFVFIRFLSLWVLATFVWYCF